MELTMRPCASQLVWLLCCWCMAHHASASLFDTLSNAPSSSPSSSVSSSTSSASSDVINPTNPNMPDLNTLTTKCDGACAVNSACIMVGKKSASPIDCEDENMNKCFTSAASTVVCLAPGFTTSESEWEFAPASSLSSNSGVGPFEAIGRMDMRDAKLLQFGRAHESLEPLPTALDVSEMVITPGNMLTTVGFAHLQLTGLDRAKPLDEVFVININKCELETVPLNFVAGSNVTRLNLAENKLQDASAFDLHTFANLARLNLSHNALESFNVKASSFPQLSTLILSHNSLQTIPRIVFQLPQLRRLELENNPIGAVRLSLEEVYKLATLGIFKVSNPIRTTACPTSEEAQKRLEHLFEFCVPESELSADGPHPQVSTTTNPTDDSNTWIILGVIIAVLFVLALLMIIYRQINIRKEKSVMTMSVMAPVSPHAGSRAGSRAGSLGDLESVSGLDDHTTSLALSIGDLSDHPFHDMAMSGIRTAGSNGASGGSVSIGAGRTAVALDSHNSDSNATSDCDIAATIEQAYIHSIRLSYNDVFLHKMLRVSSRSELWLGEYLDEPVVIKKIKRNAVSGNILRDFVLEIEQMTQLKHARIVALKGALWDAQCTEVCAVVEHMEKGSLRDIIQANIALPIPKQHAVARHLAEALTYLHERRVVHGRLNSFNVLLDREFSAKLSSFSIFHHVQLSPLDAECAVFVAPEVRRGEKPTALSDVYSFGVVLVELDTEETPLFNARRTSNALYQSAGEGAVLSPIARHTGFHLSSTCSMVMKEIVGACLSKDMEDRPTMAEVLSSLRTGAMQL